MKKSLAFTLAEVLITLAIIGVVAAMTIPSVIVNTNQQEFKTGLRKAISVLNSAITMNIALEGETPYDNADLFEYLQQHMSIMKSTTEMQWHPKYGSEDYVKNNAFYTTDGMRFEVPQITITKKLHEVTGGANNEIQASLVFNPISGRDGKSRGAQARTGNCGQYQYAYESDSNFGPCLILVDVNGDRKPTPSKAVVDETKTGQNAQEETYVYPGPTDKLLKDIFPVIITDEKAIPYGIVAQKAMYQTQNKKNNKNNTPTQQPQQQGG